MIRNLKDCKIMITKWFCLPIHNFLLCEFARMQCEVFIMFIVSHSFQHGPHPFMENGRIITSLSGFSFNIKAPFPYLGSIGFPIIRIKLDSCHHNNPFIRKLERKNGFYFDTEPCLENYSFNSLKPSDPYLRQWSRPSLVYLMACRLFGTKPLSEPMMTYCQFDHKEHISMKHYLKFRSFHSRKCIWKDCLRNGGHFVKGEMS